MGKPGVGNPGVGKPGCGKASLGFPSVGFPSVGLLSTFPLASFVFSIFGLIVLIYVVGRYIIEGGSVPGFPFLASIIAIFSGVQLFAIGVIGEYLARAHFRLMGRPAYVIRWSTSTTAEDDESV